MTTEDIYDRLNTMKSDTLYGGFDVRQEIMDLCRIVGNLEVELLEVKAALNPKIHKPSK